MDLLTLKSKHCLFLWVLFFSACSPEMPHYFSDLSQKKGTDGSFVTHEGPVVCDPFSDSDGTINSKNGLRADLRSMPEELTGMKSVFDYAIYGEIITENLFFSKLDIPTRYFSEGFVAEDGSLLLDSDGTPLFEYFSVHFNSELKLPEGVAPKQLQFAILSDDGAVLRYFDGLNWSSLVDNDGLHPTRLACSSNPIELTNTETVPIKLDYYQGPRYHIALVVLMREWTTEAEPLCGMQGNKLYFDYETKPSTPQDAYLDLLGRGWQVVPAEYYHLSSDDIQQENPCL